MIEVAIARKQVQPVLDGQGGGPEVIRRYRRALLAELTEQSCILMGRLIVGIEDLDTCRAQEPSEIRLVAFRPRAAEKAGAELGEDDKRHIDLGGALKPSERLSISSSEIDVAIGVDREPYCHDDSSMRSCAAIAWSNSGSCSQVPDRWSRSSCTGGEAPIGPATLASASRRI